MNTFKTIISVVIRKLIISILLTFLIYHVVVYINIGEIRFILHPEQVFSILLIFLTFLSHELVFYISRKWFNELHEIIQKILESILVIGITLLLTHYAFFGLANWYFGEMNAPDLNYRTAYTFTAIFSLLYFYLVDSERKKKRLKEVTLKNEALEKESYKVRLELLNNQMKPHFLFNSLNILQSLISTAPDKAESYVMDLSKLYRALLSGSTREISTLKDELEIGNAYIRMLAHRFGDKIKVETSISNDYMENELPFGVLQTLLENAIKHNKFNKNNPLNLQIHGSKTGLSVRNSLAPVESSAGGAKHGLKNITKRYKLLSNKEPIIMKTSDYFEVVIPWLNKTDES